MSRSNQSLSQSECPGLADLLSDGEIELVRCQATIYRLQEMIKDLSNQRDDLERHIRCAKSLSAPIRRLPPEILSEIFIYNGIINNIREASNIPGLKLSHVSGHWRAVAFSTPALWKDIRIETSQPDYHSRHMELVRDILSRSLACPLHVHLTAIPGDDPRFGEPGRFDQLHPAIPLLFDHVARWQVFSVLDRSKPGPQQQILDALSPIRGRLTGLSRFVCSKNAYASLLGDNATNLRSFVIGALLFTESYLWAQINELEVACSRNSQVVMVLPHLAKATTLRVRYPYYCEWQKGPVPTVHPNIVSLCIILSNDWKEEEAAEELMNSLTLPNLRSAEFINEGTRLACGKYLRHRWTATSIPSLFKRSTAPLTELSFTRTWVPVEVLLDLLTNLPTLRRLKIEEPADRPSPMLTAGVFKHLDACRDAGPLVPKLQILQLTANKLSSDLQDLFIDVLRSRYSQLSPDTPNKVARLRSVKMTLRWETTDTGVIESIMGFRREGCLISVKDQEGDVLVREYTRKLES